MRVTTKSFLMPAFIFIFTFFTFTSGIESNEVIAFDTRFYLFVQEMLQFGPSFFPTTYHEPYPDYLSTLTLIIYGLSLFNHGLNKFVAMIPTIFFASITLVFTYLIGRIQDERLGIAGVFFLLFSFFFTKTINTISLDMAVTAFTVMSFYIFYYCDTHKQLNTSKKTIIIFYLLILLSFAFRGPIGLIIPVGVVCSYLLGTSQIKRLFFHASLSTLFLIALTLILLLLALYTGGITFVRSVFYMQVLGRLNNPYLPRTFYFIDSFGSYALAYPIALLVMFGLLMKWIRKQPINEIEKLICLLFLWMLVIMIGESIPDDKKVRYILPMMPATALIAAYSLIANGKYFHYVRVFLTWLCFIFPTVCLLFLYRLLSKDFTLHYSQYLIVGFSLLAIIAWVLLIVTKKNQVLSLLGVALVAFMMSNFYIISPIQLQTESALASVNDIEALRLKDKAKLIFYKEGKDGLPIKYLINMPKYEMPLFVNHAEALNNVVNAYVITSHENERELQQREKARKMTSRKLAHVNIVVYKI